MAPETAPLIARFSSCTGGPLETQLGWMPQPGCLAGAAGPCALCSSSVYAQICRDDVGVLPDFDRRALRNHRSLLEADDAVGNAHDEVDIVLDKHNCTADLLDQFPDHRSQD